MKNTLLHLGAEMKGYEDFLIFTVTKIKKAPEIISSPSLGNNIMSFAMAVFLLMED